MRLVLSVLSATCLTGLHRRNLLPTQTREADAPGVPIAECGPRSAEAVGAAMGSTRGAQWHGDRGMCLLQPLPNSKAMPLIALAIVW